MPKAKAKAAAKKPSDYVVSAGGDRDSKPKAPMRCPDPVCSEGYHANSVFGFCVKRNKYKIKGTKQAVLRYKCKCKCGKNFTVRTESPIRR